MVKKVNDFQNGDVKADIIVLRSVFGKVGQNYLMQPQRDPNTGMLPSCVRRVDSHGDMILSADDRIAMNDPDTVFIPEDHVFVVRDGTTFDLKKPAERAEWEAIKHCPLIAPSRDARGQNGDYLIDGTTDPQSKHPRYGIAELYVDKPGVFAAKRVTRKKLVNRAQSFIINDERGYDGQLLIAKVLGRNMTNQPAADVEDYLLSFAEKDPNKIIELYTGGDLSLRLLLITAKEKRIIRKENGLYIYGEDGNVTLGASDEAVIDWMKSSRNQKTLQLIRQDTYPEMYVGDE